MTVNLRFNRGGAAMLLPGNFMHTLLRIEIQPDNFRVLVVTDRFEGSSILAQLGFFPVLHFHLEGVEDVFTFLLVPANLGKGADANRPFLG